MKYKYADYPRPFVESFIQNFKEKQISTEKTKADENTRPLIPIILSYVLPKKNAAVSNNFLIKKLSKFSDNNFSFAIIWQTRMVKTLFKLKDKSKLDEA